MNPVHDRVFGGATPTPALSDVRSFDRLELATAVRGAASGLVRRGVPAGQTVGILADALWAQILTVQMTFAAGCVAQLLDPARGPEALGAALAETGARLLITGRSLSALALAAADASHVRQIVSLGFVPGTVDYADLLTDAATDLPDRDPDDALLLAGTEAFTHNDLLDLMDAVDAPVTLTARDVLGLPPVPEPTARQVALTCLALSRATLITTTGPATVEGHDPLKR